MAVRHRCTLAAVVGTAVLVGVLWGVNIGAVYPFMEVVFRGQSLHGWIDDEIQKSSDTITQLEQSLEELRENRAKQEDREQIDLKISRQTSHLAAERVALARYHRLEPIVKRHAPSDPLRTLVWIVAFLLGFTILKNIAASINSVLVARLSQLTVLRLRMQLYRRTLNSDVSGFGRRHNSVVVSHFTHDVNKLNAGISTIFGKALLEPFKMLFCLIGACMISWRLLVLSLLISPPALILMRLLAKVIKRANHRAMEEMSQIYRVISETFNGIQTVKAFTTERYERRRFHLVLKKHLRTAMKIVVCNALARPITELLGIGVISLSLIAGAYLVIEQQTHLLGIRMSDRPLNLASLLLFYGFLAGVSGPARKLTSLVLTLQAGFAAADRIYALMDQKPRVVNPPAPAIAGPSASRMTFQNVSFAYHDDSLVLKRINLEIQPGDRVAIVGPNGCGKSTMINLMMRFYDPTQGSISLGQVDLRELRVRDIRSRISLVTQQPHLFDDTVLNNIRYGTPRATLDQVVDAAKRAHAHRFIIEKLADGYESPVGQRGNCLSGGQQQRITLARAILRDPDLLILDEATSQIDLESERAIHQALRTFVQGRTAIMVTHRLSTLRLANRVIVMDAGEIVDAGTHEDLINRCDIYQRLHEIHFRQCA